MSYKKHILDEYILGNVCKQKIAKCYDCNPHLILPFITDYIEQYHNEIKHIMMDLCIGYIQDRSVIIPYEILEILLLFYGNLSNQKVKRCILLHHKLAAFYRSCNKNTDKLLKSISKSFQSIVESKKFIMLNGLLFYINHIVTKGKHITDFFIYNKMETQHIINNIIQIISYLDEEHLHIFFNAFQNDLSTRLINNKSDKYWEGDIISKLNENCFEDYKISRLKDMMKDIEGSKEFMISYDKQSCITNDIDLNMIIATGGSWPNYNEFKMKPPIRIKQICDDFLMKYLYIYSGRRLTFIMNEGNANLTVQFNAKTRKIVVVSTLQMCILLLFNYTNTITFQQILSELRYNDDGNTINAALLSMAHPKIRILRKAPNTKHLELDDKFQINPKYENLRAKIQIPTLKIWNENKKYQYETQKELQWNDTLTSKQRVRILQWNGFVVWKYNVIGDACTICKGAIYESCIECRADPNGSSSTDNCSLAWGVCNHQFHFHCITRWLKNNGTCPVDGQQWEFLCRCCHDDF